MKKIKDRMILGMISGILGNAAKELTATFLIRVLKLGTVDGPTYAAGIHLPKRTMMFNKNTMPVKIIGLVTDHIIGAMLGVSSVYLLSYTGKDHYILKGVGLGHFSWTSMYGFLATMGATSTHPAGTKNTLNNFINHTAYGIVTHIAAVKLGDEELFKPNLVNLGKPKEDSVMEKVQGHNKPVILTSQQGSATRIFQEKS